MGRVKLHIKKLESTSSRQITYSKRKQGLAKKALELATLCDTDVALVMFSPTGRLFQVPRIEDGKIENVIMRFANLSEHEKEKRNQESTEILSKIVKSYSNQPLLANENRSGESSMDVNVAKRDFDDSLLKHQEELRRLQHEYGYLQSKLRPYQGEDLVSVVSMDELSALEEKLQETLDKIFIRKQQVMNSNFGGMMQSFQTLAENPFGQTYPTPAQDHWSDNNRQFSQHNFVQESVYSKRKGRKSEEPPPNMSFQRTYANQNTSLLSTHGVDQMLFNHNRTLEQGHQVHQPTLVMEDPLALVKEESLRLPTPGCFVKGDDANQQAQSVGLGANVGLWTHQCNLMGPSMNQFSPKVSTSIELDGEISKNSVAQFAYTREEKPACLNVMHQYSGHIEESPPLDSMFHGLTSPSTTTQNSLTSSKNYGSIFPQ
ncbi:hypothetical protein O6H91_04G136300 [Diphasiastrum complanatum]|uniref:Uncharacterized protein n=1 Tax=Diphasiastrum complanatum TaxID=34168 RepID=A0ACC2E2S0_DIPCM|nr:hypothetical protein O6H91_04G136300 [Diphasiastrum complanatum]